MGLKETGKWMFLHGTPLGLKINTTKNMVKKFDYMFTPENVVKHVYNVYEKGPVLGTLKTTTESYINATKKVVQDELNDAIAYSPITTIPYNIGKNSGHYEGKKEGIVEASSKYEKVCQNLEQKIVKVQEYTQKCINGHEEFEDELILENDRLNKELELYKEGK